MKNRIICILFVIISLSQISYGYCGYWTNNAGYTTISELRFSTNDGPRILINLATGEYIWYDISTDAYSKAVTAQLMSAFQSGNKVRINYCDGEDCKDFYTAGTLNYRHGRNFQFQP